MKYAIVEKANRLAVHGYFDTLERAERHLREVIPDYCRRGFFMNKTLAPADFEVIERKVRK